MAGMKDIKSAGAKADAWIRMGRDFNSFVNKHTALVTEVRQTINKDLNTVTDADLDTYFGQNLDAEAHVSGKAFCEVFQDMIDTVKAARDKLPANDIEDVAP